MRDVLVVLFWLWLLVALGVYVYRLVRRLSQGPKSERQARAGAAADDAPSGTPPPRRAFGRTELPPLPDGPVEARLPRSLQGVVPEGTPSGPTEAGDATGVQGAAPPSAPPRTSPTLAEAVAGIQLPEGLLPVVDAGAADERSAVFSGTGTTVADVAEALAGELRRLGYTVDGLDTVTPSRAGLSARRDDVAVAATLHLDDDGAVVLELRT